MSETTVFDNNTSAAFHTSAFEKFARYTELSGCKPIPATEQMKIVRKVYDLASKLLVVEDGRFTRDSINLIAEKKLSKAFELNNLELKLFHLLILEVEKLTGISAGPIPTQHHIRQEQPVITPDALLHSGFHATLYEHLEDESACKAYLGHPQEKAGYVLLWLILKEGIRRQSDLALLLEDKHQVYQINEHWFFDIKDRRYWLSPKAELLLCAWYQRRSDINGFRVMSRINQYLKKEGLLSSQENLKLAVLKDAVKVEHTLKYGAIDCGLSAYTLKTTALKPSALVRLLTGTPVLTSNTTAEKQLYASIRQQRAWKSAHAPTSKALRINPRRVQKEITVKSQLKIIQRFTELMEKLGVAERKERTKQIKTLLRKQLEDNEKAKAYPWCWLILAWMFQLLHKGGKAKKRLKLTTIKSYIDYVAEPFLNEFSGSAPALVSPIEWAEKINIAVEQIQSVHKKAFVGYFVEYLVDNQFAEGLCLSDIDIPGAKGAVNANLMTIHEASLVSDECEAHSARVGQLASVVFCLGFYCGLRRGEIAGLQFKDITCNDDLSYVNLHVRPNQYRELKSTDSARNLPLDALVPSESLEKLCQYMVTHKTKFAKQTSLVFSDNALLSQSFNLVTTTMQLVTGDPSMRFHHCRHSFCNWTYVRLSHTKGNEWSQYTFLDADYFSEKHCEQLKARLEISSYTRKKMWALATLLGHASPTTSISSYLHIVDWSRRARFANHTPTPSEQRIIWGQRIKTGTDGRVVITPRLETLYESLMPKQLEWIEYESVAETAINNTTSQPYSIVDLAMVWRVIRRLGEGFSIDETAEGLKLPYDTVERIQHFDREQTEIALTKSKRVLEPLANYQNLNRGNVKAVETLVFRFNESAALPESDALNLALLQQILPSFVGAKDNLIRTTDHNAALTLIRLLKLMRLPAENLRIKWYFPNLASYELHNSDRYRNDFQYWRYAIQERCGYSAAELECIVPRECEHLLKGKANGVKLSDDGRFLRYSNRGYVSIHLMQTRFRSTVEHREVKNARRTRSFVSFLRLLVIYQKLTLRTTSAPE